MMVFSAVVLPFSAGTWWWLIPLGIIGILLLIVGRARARSGGYDIEGSVGQRPDIQIDERVGRPDVSAGRSGPDISEQSQTDRSGDRRE
jgi:hypothetical protein